MNPQTWKIMVDAANEVFLALGDGKKIIDDNGHIVFKYDKNNQFGIIVEIIISQFNSTAAANSIIERIKEWVKEVEEDDGNEYTWTTDYAFALALTEGEGDWVNAQFTSTHTNPESELSAEVFYEFYHILDGKVQEWNQFKRDVPR